MCQDNKDITVHDFECVRCGTVNRREYRGHSKPLYNKKQLCTECGFALPLRYCSPCNTLQSIDNFYPYRTKTEPRIIMAYEHACKECKKKRKKIQRALIANGRSLDAMEKDNRRRAWVLESTQLRRKIIAAVSDAPPLNETQWRQIVEYFNGCALCDAIHVEVRYPLLTPPEGGKYAAPNVIPLCSKCKDLYDLAQKFNKKDAIRILRYTTLDESKDVSRLIQFLRETTDKWL